MHRTYTDYLMTRREHEPLALVETVDKTVRDFADNLPAEVAAVVERAKIALASSGNEYSANRAKDILAPAMLVSAIAPVVAEFSKGATEFAEMMANLSTAVDACNAAATEARNIAGEFTEISERVSRLENPATLDRLDDAAKTAGQAEGL